MGQPAVSYGKGTELRVLGDNEIFTTRFDGWSSWHRTVSHYVLPELAEHAESIEQALIAWRAEAVVTSGFATAARIAAFRAECILIEATIYPQLSRLRQNRRFALRFRTEVRQLVRTNDLDVADRVAWGIPADVILHDPYLGGGASSTGYPYWDLIPFVQDDVHRILDWIAASNRPAVLGTLGSFVGASASIKRNEIIQSIRLADARIALVGPGSGSIDIAPRDLRLDRFVPLSKILNGFQAVIHHGGIGTTFGCLMSGVPAAVTPIAFDQPRNADAIERAGGGFSSARRPLHQALEMALSDPTRRSTHELRNRLLPTEDAAHTAADIIERLASQ